MSYEGDTKSPIRLKLKGNILCLMRVRLKDTYLRLIQLKLKGVILCIMRVTLKGTTPHLMRVKLKGTSAF